MNSDITLQNVKLQNVMVLFSKLIQPLHNTRATIIENNNYSTSISYNSLAKSSGNYENFDSIMCE